MLTMNCIRKLRNHNHNSFNFDYYNLENYYKKASKYVKKFCARHSIKCEIVIIEPGFTKNFSFFEGSDYHYFIIEIKGIKYLVDCTYKQFFLIKEFC